MLRSKLVCLLVVCATIVIGCDGGGMAEDGGPADAGTFDGVDGGGVDGGQVDGGRAPCATAEECDDGLPCTDDACVDGACAHAPRAADCNDGNECTADACTEAGCASEPVADGTACASGAGECAGGACVTGCASPEACDDGVLCTSDVCTDGACTNPPHHSTCNDGNECTADACAPTGCASSPLPDGTSCAGGDGECTGGDCVTGCTTAAHCNDGVDCTDNLCEDGVCRNLPRHDACDDGNECTASTCTVSGCDATPMAAGAPCAGGYCAGGACVECADASHCDDGIACTVDACVADACSVEPDHALCDDGNECTADSCTAAGCEQVPVTDGASCDGGAGTCRDGACAEPAGFRIDTVELQHPHALADRTACSFGICGTVCDDFTFDDLYAQPPYGSLLVSEGLNPSVQSSIDDLTMSYVGLLAPLRQVDGFVGQAELVESDCATATSCVPTAGGHRSTTDYTVQRSGTCLAAPASGLFAGAWPDGRTTTTNAPAAGADGCFVTDPMSLTVEVTIGGSRVALPLTDAQVAGRFVGEPATELADGLVVGFLSEAVADTIDVTVPFPGGGSVTVNMGRDVLPDDGAGSGACGPRSHCLGPDARTTFGGECGWWFAFNLTAQRIADVSAY